MSSAVVSTPAAQSRPFVFDLEEIAAGSQASETALAGARPPQRALPGFKESKLAGVTPASRLALRPAPEMASSGIAAMDALTGGLPRGCLTEICGAASSGRTTLLLAALAAATRRGECCALVDAGDALDPQSAAAAGIDLDRLLWVRCGEDSPRRRGDTEKPKYGQGSEFQDSKFQGSKFNEKGSQQGEHRLEQLLRAADLLLESGGFGLIALDLGDLPPQAARHIPLTTWFRFRRAVEHTPTVLLAVERQSIAGSCSSLLIKLGIIKLGIKPGLTKLGAQAGVKQSTNSLSTPTHAQLLTEMEITAELVRSKLDRKPVRSAEISWKHFAI